MKVITMKPIAHLHFVSGLMKKMLLCLACSTLCLLSVRADLTNGLIAYFPFNGNANDESGNGHNGVINGATLTVDRLGRSAKAYSFNGTSNYISAVIPNLPAGTASRTITGWLKPAPQPHILSAIGYGAGNGNGQFGLGCAANANEFYFWKGLTDFPTHLILPFDFWSFVAASYDSNQVLTLWVNNSYVTWNGCDQYGCIDTSNNQKLFIGAVSADGNTPSAPLGGGWQLFYTGAIDDVRIYNRALSTNEVAQLYDLEAPPRIDLIKAVKPSFSHLSLGTNYQLQVSADLNTWTNQGSPFTASSPTMVYPQYWDVDNWTKLFFRLQVAP